ncbi:short chain dehydrogenase [Chitinophaga nivalis]|uniref:Short chain dehydrogenase n=1 Tax=Chitinophaga nivalis TaxID=2991709 RepID=A0ABT3IIT0_9BACT|nr:short chain dehydrogenase [Chitinophaga nivalis]MCW3466450.1 short chain dehydrogenase [Chitinophaga nivalis]MCW3483859.1 short chain dehydrogenase [Chitinophaga nivalis]
MKILVIGASGTIGRKLVPALSSTDTIITAGRNSGDIRVDVTDATAIRQLFQEVKGIDACICIAASGPLDNFSTLTEKQLLADMQGKLFGQINLVLIGQHYLNDNGSFTLTSGIFADIPYKGVTGGAIVSGGLHSFVLNAAIELPRGLRINVVSPGMVEDSAKDFGHLFPGLQPVSMQAITDAYRKSIYENNTGQLIKVY